jgi:uncharacterized iron-regulated membrane protein
MLQWHLSLGGTRIHLLLGLVYSVTRLFLIGVGLVHSRRMMMSPCTSQLLTEWRHKVWNVISRQALSETHY